MSTLHFSHAHRSILAPYLPPHGHTPPPLRHMSDRPFVTLTYAQSLDSQIALSPNQPTALSGPSSKAMTHFLRSTHDAILVGSGTAIADDPSLNCRLDDVVNRMASPHEPGEDTLAGQPRPVVLDRRGRWAVGKTSRVVGLAMEGKGRGPWILIARDANESMSAERQHAVEAAGGGILTLGGDAGFAAVLDTLSTRGIRSVMVEGGAILINEIFTKYRDLVDSVVVTVAPVLLGHGGAAVCPARDDPGKSAVRFCAVQYLILDHDIVMCGTIQKDANV